MERSRWPDRALGADHAGWLLDAAMDAIIEGLMGRPPSAQPPRKPPDELRARVGVFVTLHVGDELNGCIGNVEGVEPLSRAVPRLARSAAFGDPRLPPLGTSDLDRLVIRISLLSPLWPLDCESYDALIRLVRPPDDGVVVRSGRRQGLFLPSVWAQLPDAGDFVGQLFHKAGLAPGCWPAGTEAFRFATTTYRRGPGDAGSDSEVVRASR